MSAFHRFRRRLEALLRPSRREADMAEEISFHLAQRARRERAAGQSPQAAQQAALREFGGVEQIKERIREERTYPWLEHLLQDFRYAFRQLTKHRGLAAVAILTLALGIGANTALFSVLDAMLYAPLPVSHPHELITTLQTGAFRTTLVPHPAYLNLRDQARTVTALASAVDVSRAVSGYLPHGTGASHHSSVSAVSGNYFTVLGIGPALGRFLDPSDDHSAQPVVVVSDSFWRATLNADPAVLGRTIRIDNLPFTVIGVAPRGFRGISGIDPVDLFIPDSLRDALDGPRDPRFVDMISDSRLIGRLAPGINREQADVEFAALFAARQAELSNTRYKNLPAQARDRLFATQLHVRSARAGDVLRFEDRFRPMLPLLAAVAAMVLILACTNVAGLLYARGLARRRELGLRSALGASTRRLTTQLLAESLLLALAAGAASLVIAEFGARILVTQVDPSARLNLGIDGRIFGATVGVSLLVGTLVGLIPAMRFNRPALMDVLKDEAGATSLRSRQWISQAILVVQVAISLILLAGAGLFVGTLRNLDHVDLGYEPEHTVLFTYFPSKLIQGPASTATYLELYSRLRALPGIQSASFSMGGMGRGTARFAVAIDGYTPKSGEEVIAEFTTGGPDYFQTVGTPLLRGREYRSHDPLHPDPKLPSEMVVSEYFARRYFGDSDPIGRTVRLSRNAFTIVGVCANAKYDNLREAPFPQAYISVFDPGFAFAGGRNSFNYQLRCTGPLEPLTSAIRAIARNLDAQFQISDVITLREVIDRALATERTVAFASSGFSLVALLLTALGLYGALAFNVTQRTREIGVRMALGADAPAVVRLIYRQGLAVVAIGAALGLLVTPLLVRFVASRLFGLSPFDPYVFGTALALLLLTALLACVIPAYRAVKVDPLVALRHD